MVARHQDVGRRHAAELARPRVLRIVEQFAFERLEFRRLGATEDAGDQPHRGFEHDHGGEFAAGQHEVAERDLLPGESLADAFVVAFVAAAQEQQPFSTAEFACFALVEGATAGTEQDLVEGAVGALQVFNGCKDRFRLQHHAGSAAERSIVDRPVRIQGVVPEVDEVDPEVALGLRDPEDALVQVGPEGRRKEGQDGAAQRCLARNKGRGD